MYMLLCLYIHNNRYLNQKINNVISTLIADRRFSYYNHTTRDV